MRDMSPVHERLGETIQKYDVLCPICKTGPWSTGRLDQDQLRIDFDAPRPPEPRNVEAVCENCGYVMAFRIAPLMGEWPKDEEDD